MLAVQRTAEFRRIDALPRVTNHASAEIVEAVSQALGGVIKLRRVQVEALLCLFWYGGLFGGRIGVGKGKTIISYLARLMACANTALLLLPADLIGKTQREFAKRREAFPTAEPPTCIVSYQRLGRESAAGLLEELRPDLIITDESQCLKNLKAAVTRRVARYMKAHPQTKFVVLSGTIMKKSIRDFAHLLKWSLKDGAPIPSNWPELQAWSECIDEDPYRLDFMARDPGALRAWVQPGDTDDEAGIRRGFQKRLLETPGVVSDTNEGGCDASILIQQVTHEVSQATRDNFETLRERWETPDGWALYHATEVYICAQQLALGFHYVHVPRPSDAYRNGQRTWGAFVRQTLSHSRRYDSELQVRNACARGELDSRGAYEDWIAVRKTEPRGVQKAVWHDDSSLAFCEEWMSKTRGLVWVDHVEFGEVLSARTGAPYYGEGGMDRNGVPVEEDPSGRSIILSRRANSKGRNTLVRWSRNLVVTPPSSPDDWEQMIGRPHRTGQEADVVTFDVLTTCAEHDSAFRGVFEKARAQRDTIGLEQKLLIADVNFTDARF